MKVRSAIKAMCKHCYVVRRGKIRFVYCKETPKHKQRQGFHTMAHDEFTFCSVCTEGTVDESAAETFFPVSLKSASTLPNIGALSMSDVVRNNLKTEKARLIPAAGIYSIL